MAAADDIAATADMCAQMADNQTALLEALGPRPTDPQAAAQWDTQALDIRTKAGELDNKASALSAVSVSDALAAVWPQLRDLGSVTQAAVDEIKSIDNLAKAMTTVANAISFAGAVLALAAAPSPGSASAVASALEKLAGS